MTKIKDIFTKSVDVDKLIVYLYEREEELRYHNIKVDGILVSIEAYKSIILNDNVTEYVCPYDIDGMLRLHGFSINTSNKLAFDEIKLVID